MKSLHIPVTLEDVAPYSLKDIKPDVYWTMHHIKDKSKIVGTYSLKDEMISITESNSYSDKIFSMIENIPEEDIKFTFNMFNGWIVLRLNLKKSKK
jgi:hypothetical protein